MFNYLTFYLQSDLNQVSKLALLRISNNILKKLSLTKDRLFRGRIQMLRSKVFPMSERSGVNLNGIYSKNTTTIQTLSSLQNKTHSLQHSMNALEEQKITEQTHINTQSSFNQTQQSLDTNIINSTHLDSFHLFNLRFCSPFSQL